MSRTVNMPAFAYIIFTQHFVLRCFYLQLSRCLIFQEAQQHLLEHLLGRPLVQYFTLTGRPSSRRLSRSRSYISHSTVCSYSPETPSCQWVSLKQKVATVYFLEHHGRHPWHGCPTLSRRLQGAWCRDATRDTLHGIIQFFVRHFRKTSFLHWILLKVKVNHILDDTTRYSLTSVFRREMKLKSRKEVISYRHHVANTCIPRQLNRKQQWPWVCVCECVFVCVCVCVCVCVM